MNQPVLITTPYSFDGKLHTAYSDTFNRVAPDDWVCFMDGDAAFLETPDFGHLLRDYIAQYPETGMFTCYATRCHYPEQTRKGVDPAQDSILYVARKTVEVRKLHPQVKDMNRRVAGHLLMLKRSVWDEIQPTLTQRLTTKNKKILGFDTQLSYSLLDHGYDIKVMRGLLVFHYLRMLTGKNTKIK